MIFKIRYGNLIAIGLVLITACKQKTGNTSKVVANSAVKKPKEITADTIHTENKPLSATGIKELLKGAWAADNTNAPSFLVRAKYFDYVGDDSQLVPYSIIGDSIFYRSTDYSSHYRLKFNGKDTMFIVDSLGSTRFHRVKNE